MPGLSRAPPSPPEKKSAELANFCFFVIEIFQELYWTEMLLQTLLKILILGGKLCGRTACNACQPFGDILAEFSATWQQ